MNLEHATNDTFLSRLTQILDVNSGSEQFGVKELAEKANISKSQLLRKLHNLVGKSTSRFIREYRLQKAMELLQTDEATASEIAYKVGFSSPTYFSSCFHEYFGYPPGEARLRQAADPSHTNPNWLADDTIGKIQPKVSKHRVLLWLTLGILIIGATSFALYFGVGETTSLNSLPAEYHEKSIAVLPFVNLSGDSDLEYISDGMTDAVISRLTKIRSIVRVIPFTTMATYKATDKSIKEIAKELGVTHILEGNFQKSGETVMIRLNLINAPEDNYFWSEDFTGDWQTDALFEIQAQVAENVAKHMDVEVTDIELESIQKIPTSSKEAYKFYLQAEYQKSLSSKSGFENAVPLYEKAIELDSSFAEAYLGMARMWQMAAWYGFYKEREAILNGRAYLRKLMDLDPKNMEIADQYHFCRFLYDWDFENMEEYYLNYVGNGMLHHSIQMMDYACKTNRVQTVYSVVEKGISEEPNNAILYSYKARCLWILGQTEEALQVLEESSPLYTNNWWFQKEVAKMYFYLGDFDRSNSLLDKLITVEKEFPTNDIFMLKAFYAQIQNGDVQDNRFLASLIKNYQEKTAGSPGYWIALYYCASKNYEEAITWLQRSYDRHEVEMTWLNAEPLLAPLRNDPRYWDLFEKIGFSKVIPALPNNMDSRYIR